MPALYRTYRPQTWEALVGQETIARTLQNEIRTGRIAHAYLFSGPRGVGKTTTARLLAKTINCTGRAADSAEPDNTCAACVAIAERSAIDLIELDAATNTGIDMVRENIIENAVVRPMQLKYKVFIIDEVHRLSPNSFDALLKTLEEPPAHVVFILATTELHKLPDTILSRCQRFTFNHIAPDVMRTRLLEICGKEGATVADAVIDTVVARSGGCMRDAESLLDQLLSLGANVGPDEAALILPPSVHTDAYPFVEMVLGGDTAGALGFLQTLVAKGISLEAFAKAIIEILRALLVLQFAPDMTFPYLEGFERHKDGLLGIASKNSPLQEILSAFLEALPALKHSSIPELPLELALVRVAGHPGAPVSHPETKTPLLTKEGAGGGSEAPPVIARNGALRSDEAIPSGPTPTTPPVIPDAPRDPESSVIASEAPGEAKQSREATTPLSSTDATPILRRLITEMQKTNPSLGIILAGAQTLGTETDHFVITVAFPLYHDQLMNNNNRRLIETQLCAITSVPWKLECRVVAEESAEESAESSLASEIAAAFGGEVL